MLLTTTILFLISCLVLVLSGGWLIKLLIKIAAHLKFSEFVVAFIIMAFSTSLPELFVGIDSAIRGKPILSLGNVLGSNIADLTLIIGIVALLGNGIKIKNPHIKKDTFLMFVIILLPILLMAFDKTLSRIDGAILIATFFIYLHHMITKRRELHSTFKAEDKKNVTKLLVLFVLSLCGLFLGANFVVKYAIALASELILPPILIGLFLIAIGTSLPELVFESRAILAKKGDLAIGDAMGSVVCNSTLVLGITALITPISNSFLIFLTSAFFLILVSFLFMMWIRTKKGLSVNEATSLIIIYLLYVFLELYFKSAM